MGYITENKIKWISFISFLNVLHNSQQHENSVCCLWGALCSVCGKAYGWDRSKGRRTTQLLPIQIWIAFQLPAVCTHSPSHYARLQLFFSCWFHHLTTFTRHIPSTSTLVSCRRVVQPVECYSAPNHHHHHRQHPSIVSHGVLIHHQKKKSIKPDRIPTLTLVCMKVSSWFFFSFPFFLLSTDAEQTPLLYYSVWAFKLPPVSFIFHHFAFMKSFSSLYTFQFCHSLCAFLLKVKKENCIWNDKMTMETLVASLNSLCAI